jgi:hypothetical protein
LFSWGVPKHLIEPNDDAKLGNIKDFDGEEQTRQLEVWTRSVGGVQCLCKKFILYLKKKNR